MNVSELKTHVLNWLYEQYKLNPTATWDIAVKLKEYELTAPQEIIDLGFLLKKNGLVKDNSGTRGNTFFATISLRGIKSISSDLDSMEYHLLMELIQEGKDQLSLMEHFNFEPEQFQRAHDFASYMKNRGLLECTFHHSDVIVRINLQGREYYENNQARFLSL